MRTKGEVQSTVLDNGVRVLSEELDQFRSATVGIWVENGSRYETAPENGISHFLEHVFFKGTNRRSARKIAEEIEAVGGILNAFTGRELTCYYARVLGTDLPLALDVLGDVFCESTFPPDEIEREREELLEWERFFRCRRSRCFSRRLSFRCLSCDPWLGVRMGPGLA